MTKSTALSQPGPLPIAVPDLWVEEATFNDWVAPGPWCHKPIMHTPMDAETVSIEDHAARAPLVVVALLALRLPPTTWILSRTSTPQPTTRHPASGSRATAKTTFMSDMRSAFSAAITRTSSATTRISSNQSASSLVNQRGTVIASTAWRMRDFCRYVSGSPLQ
jgi:hypothetical protein